MLRICVCAASMTSNFSGQKEGQARAKPLSWHKALKLLLYNVTQALDHTKDIFWGRLLWEWNESDLSAGPR